VISQAYPCGKSCGRPCHGLLRGGLKHYFFVLSDRLKGTVTLADSICPDFEIPTPSASGDEMP